MRREMWVWIGMVAALTLTSAPAAAQTAIPEQERALEETETPISEPEWRALVRGKTLSYEHRSGLVGREFYPPSSEDRAIFVYADGRCYDGAWRYNDGVYCFEFDGVHCFEHFRRGESLWVREILSGEEQRVTAIVEDAPLACEPALTS